MHEDIQKDLARMTLGYGLMCVLDDTDNHQGPTLVRRSINKRDINLEFMEKVFMPEVKRVGLQNTIAVNAILVGVEKNWIDMDSLQPIHDGVYTNRAKWTESGSEEPERKSTLFNGNHRCHLMRQDVPRMQAYTQYHNAIKELAKNPQSPVLVRSLKEAKSKALNIIEKEGTWLVRFIDMGEESCLSRRRFMQAADRPQTTGELKSSQDHLLIRHHICQNRALVSHNDTDNDEFVQMLTTLGEIEPEDFENYLKSLLVKLSSSRSERIVSLIRDRKTLRIAINLYKWASLRSRKGVGSLSARYFSDRNPHFGGVSKSTSTRKSSHSSSFSVDSS